MRLLHVVTFRLSLLAALLLTFWAVFFYFAMMEEINDEVDDSLENYAEMIITRSLRGEPLPQSANGTNNHYYQREVSVAYADTTPHVEYADRDIYLHAKDEVEPARVITYIYMRADGTYMELTVAIPNIDKSDLKASIAYWIVFLYVVLMLSIVVVNLWAIHRTMRPLSRLLSWLDQYRLGQSNAPLQNPTRIREFQKLNETVERSVKRGEELYEQQKVFIGNASHEMQTPIAVCQNRIEMLLDEEGLNEVQMGELIKVRQTLSQLSRLNKSLLLLCKIENGQFTHDVPTDLTEVLKTLLVDYEMVYASRFIRTEVALNHPFEMNIDETLVSVLLSNLLKNAYVHNRPEGLVRVASDASGLTIENTGVDHALEVAHIFKRFYHTSTSRTSSGLGLPLVEAVSKRYALRLTYSFVNGLHRFRLEKGN